MRGLLLLTFGHHRQGMALVLISFYLHVSVQSEFTLVHYWSMQVKYVCPEYAGA